MGAALAAIDVSVFENIATKRLDLIAAKAAPTVIHKSFRGIENQTIDRAARGEYDQAVVTPDDTRNQENRRVVIDFRR